MKSFLLKFFLGDSHKGLTISEIRERILKISLVSATIIGTALFITAVIPALRNRLYGTIGFYSILYGFLIFITFYNRASYKIKAVSWLSILYANGVINLILSGFNVDGGIFLLALVTMTALLFSFKDGLIALLLSVISVSLAGFFYITGRITPALGLPQSDPMKWIIGGMIFLGIGFYLLISFTLFHRGVEENFTRATDLTEELFNTTHSLQEVEERFQALIESSTEVIAIIGPEKTIQYISPSVEELSGFKVKELIGKKIIDFIHPDDLSTADSTLTSAILEEDKEFLNTIRRKDKSGSWKTLEVSGKSMIRHPAIKGVVISARDISEQQMIENSMKESRRMVEETLANINEAVIIFDSVTLKVLDCNLAVADMFGYSKEEMLGSSQVSLFINQGAKIKFLKEMKEAINEKGALSRFEHKMKKKDGTIFPVEHSVIPMFNERGEPKLNVAVIRDISIQKETEHILKKAKEDLENQINSRNAELKSATLRLTELAIHSPVIIYSVQPSKGIGATFVTGNVENILGYNAKQFHDDPYFWRKHIHPDDLDGVIENLKLLESRGRILFEYRFLHKNGSYRWMRDESYLMMNKGGQPPELVGSWTDISEKKTTGGGL